jgi:hypothetical protein
MPITEIMHQRHHNQRLSSTNFRKPQDVVRWLGPASGLLRREMELTGSDRERVNAAKGNEDANHGNYTSSSS